jgi:subtilase family serine protease
VRPFREGEGNSKTVSNNDEVFMKLPVRSVALGLCVGLSALPSSLFAAEKAVLEGRVEDSQPVSFEVYVPIQKREQLEKDLQAMHDPSSPTYQKWLTPAEFQTRYGATPEQLAAIKEQLAGSGLEATVVGGHVHVTGKSVMVERALGTSLVNAAFPSGRRSIVATRSLTPPEAMTRLGAKVVGLSGTMMMRTHSHLRALPDNRYASYGGYWFDDLKQAYSFPSYLVSTGKGTTIATLTDGAYIPSDMKIYFDHEKLAEPDISEVEVAGGSSVGASTEETNLDLQQAGGMAPAAKIVHYNLPDLSDNSIIDGLSQLITENKADVVSMSFGEPELYYTAAYNDGVDFTYILQIYDDIFAQGNAQGITFIASSGDSGGLAAVPLVCFNYGPNCGAAIPAVNFPASSPHVTGVGGTNLTTTYMPGSLDSAYVSEEAFGDPLSEDIFYGTSASGLYWGSGGGDSVVFSKPLYQDWVPTGNAKYRTVPDVALQMGGCPNYVLGNCNPADSYTIEVLGGEYYGVIGTSVAAPDVAGLTALLVEHLGHRLGNFNYLLYTLAQEQNAGSAIKPFKKGIPGFNGEYSTSAAPYDRVLGNGTLTGIDVLLNPHGLAAGVPQTPSNP